MTRRTGPEPYRNTDVARPPDILRAVPRSPPGTPVAGPQTGCGQGRAAARRLLPGVRCRRHVLRRYSLTGERPGP
ncbi:hypothetical protein GCM10010466_57210 [Planomonospora alba]|uniref:Uncharacterized protein n=1 Tax=Planomonospora alba TaxID=161354 RepID=A0ABP6NVA9_9ACTN